MAAPLASAEELGDHLQYTVPESVALLALAGASGTVRSHCGWDLVRETTTFKATGAGGVILTLPTLNLVSVSAIRIGGVAVAAGAPAPVILPRGQLIWAPGWPTSELIEVDAIHGCDPVPDVVRLVTLTIAARIVNNPENLKSSSTGTVTRTYDARMTELDIRLLDPYRV